MTYFSCAWATQWQAKILVYEDVSGVYGDMRLPNIAVHQEGQHWHVRFLDFDWAGLAGQHRYHPFMNPEVIWPVSVCPFAVMLLEHDVTSLRMEFDQRVR